MVKEEISNWWYVSPIITFILSWIFWLGGLILAFGIALQLNKSKNRRKAVIIAVLNTVAWIIGLILPIILPIV